MLNGLVGLLWVAFICCWLIWARFTKQRARRNSGVRGLILVRLIIAALLLLYLLMRRQGMVRGLGAYLERSLVPSVPVRLLGLVLCVAGFGVAIWARATLGRNWGLPMSLRVRHELVTRGPYAHLRHPIYSALLLAALGSAFAQSALWVAAFVLMLGYFLYSARQEERLMRELFPETYPEYQQRTKMMIPFVL